MRKIMFLLSGALMLLTTSCLKGPSGGGKSASDFKGRLVVTDTATGKTTYTDKDAVVTVTIPNILEPKLTILFNGVKFAEAMPVKLNLELTNIPFTVSVSEDGLSQNYVFDAEDIIPTSFDSEYKIDRVWGSLGKKIDIRFVMEKRGSQVQFTTEPQPSEEENGGEAPSEEETTEE